MERDNCIQIPSAWPGFSWETPWMRVRGSNNKIQYEWQPSENSLSHSSCFPSSTLPQNHFNLPHPWVIYQRLNMPTQHFIAEAFCTFNSKLSRSLSLLQYDYMERLDGKEKWSVVESPRERRSIQTVVLNEAVFVQYLDAGSWHLAFYNDGREMEMVSFSTNIMGETGGICVGRICVHLQYPRCNLAKSLEPLGLEHR